MQDIEKMKPELLDSISFLYDIYNKDFVSSARIQSLEDLAAIISIDRPNVVEVLGESFIKGQLNPESISYEHNSLVPIISETYGIIVYQEQIVQILSTMSGMTIEQGDLVRKLLCKKARKDIPYWRKVFIYGSSTECVTGCLKKGIPEDVASNVFSRLEKEACYSFRKAHALKCALTIYSLACFKVCFFN